MKTVDPVSQRLLRPPSPFTKPASANPLVWLSSWRTLMGAKTEGAANAKPGK